MSLINQMLKDLDARRSDIVGGSSFGQQIRAVPERRRVHPAWWVALALAGMLIGVIAFIVLRPTPSAPHGISSRLPLKLDIDIHAAVPQHSGQPAMPDANSETVNPVPASTEQLALPNQATVDPVEPAKAATTAERAPAAPQSTELASPVKERVAPVPRAAEVIPAPKVLAPMPTPKTSDMAVPPAINKQFKELTPVQRAENEYRKAVLALQQGKRSEAVGGLEQALQFDPKHAGARQALIGVLLDGKQQDEALLKAREGLDADPTQSGLAMILARLQLDKGELRMAIETLERTLAHASDKADYLAFLAALLQRDERHKQAVEQYLLALQKAPQNGVWWMGLGISLQAERRIPEAQESFKRAKATSSLSPELLAFVEARLSQLRQ